MQRHPCERDENSIRVKAYELWIARGCPEGTAEQDWLEAERQLLAVTNLAADEGRLAPAAARARTPAPDAPRKVGAKPKAPSRAAPRARSKKAG